MKGQNTARPKLAYVGRFTTEKRKARGKGVAVFSIDPTTGAWTFVEACDRAQARAHPLLNDGVV